MDMADKYEPLSYTDEYADPDSEPTVKIQVPTFHPQVVVDEQERDTIPAPPPIHEETRYPGAGLLLVLSTSFLFWAAVLWAIAKLTH